MLTVLSGLAEFERDLIRARTGEGRARAVARGQKMGRPFKLTDHQKREAIKRGTDGSQTHRWRKTDSNSRSPREGKSCGQPLQASIAGSDLNL
jgi:DNA invertase Pin-like site-specific DNA recombinase